MSRRRQFLLAPPLVAVAGILLAAAVVLGDDWSHWRGPGRNGVSAEDSRFDAGSWPPGDAKWKAALGEGSSAPIVVGPRVYTMGWTDGQDHVVCLDAATGKTLWSQSYSAPRYGRNALGDQGIYSGPSSTPEYDEATGYLYTLGADGDLHCWDTRRAGRLVWHVNLYEKYQAEQRPRVGRSGRRDYGYTTAPLVYKDWVLVEAGGKSGSVVALAKETGLEQWTSEYKDPPGHAGGLVPLRVEGIACLAVQTHFHLLVVRLDAGNEGRTVAAYDWVTSFSNSIATPAVAGDHVLITSGYNHNAICKLKITLAGATKVWERPYASKVCSPVIHDGHIYWSWQKVHCLDLETGQQLWEGGSFSDPGSCIATADNRLIVWGGRGKLALVETAARSPRAYRELAVRDRLFSTDAWPHVALAGGQLYCKDRDGHLLCFDLGAANASTETDGEKPVGSEVGGTSPPEPLNREKQPKAPEPVDLSDWLGTKKDLLLAWRQGLGPQIVGPGESTIQTWRFEPKGLARAGEGGPLHLSHGALVIRGGNRTLLDVCKRTGQLSVEAVLTSANDKQRGPARIISFSTTAHSRNFTLGQENDRLIFRLRTTQTGTNGTMPEVDLCPVTPGKPQHVIVSYRAGRLSCYLDGRQVLASTAIRGDFGNWSPQQLLLGNEWDGQRDWAGQIERVALWSRFVEPAEARRRFESAESALRLR